MKNLELYLLIALKQLIIIFEVYNKYLTSLYYVGVVVFVLDLHVP